MNPSISIVLCTYNGAKFLREQLDSLMRQTMPAFEIIVRDDASTDTTWEFLNDYARRFSSMKISRNENNQGFMRNFALALQEAQGDYIAYCDQDDIWTDDHLEVLMNLIADKDLAVGNALLIDEKAHSMGFSLREEFRYNNVAENEIDKLYPIFYRQSVYQGASMLLTKSLKESLLPFPEGLAFHDVWTAAMACCKSGINDTDRIITLYRQHGKNVTSHRKPSIFRELKMRHHVTFSPDRIYLHDALRERIQPMSPALDEFLRDWMWYYLHAKRKSYHFRAFCHRFRRYKKIYTSKDFRYFCLRALQALVTPAFK
ncbi:MAG: glycosyltransferase [Bacteroidales bacterium]|nr:glycosyltransferase [Bacteroidales bacterium]